MESQRIELVYFEGCPGVEPARRAIRGAGVSRFLEVDQARLAEGDPRGTYSSPSLVIDGRLAIGCSSGAPSCSFEVWTPEAVRAELDRAGISADPTPVACLLGDREFRARQERVRATLREARPSVLERPDGYEIRFDSSSGVLAELLELIRLERQCCPFLGFTLALEPGSDQARLTVFSRPEVADQVKPLLRELFSPSSTSPRS